MTAPLLNLNADGLTEREASDLFRLELYGDITETSPSEAVWKLCKILCLLSRDPADIDQRMRGSGLFLSPEMHLRDGKTVKAGDQVKKWDRLGATTMRKALAQTEIEWKRRQYVLEQQQLDVATGSTDHEPSSVRARTVADIWKDPDALKPPVAVIPRLAWRGYVTVYAAPDKAGKSTLVSAGVAALTTGQKFLDGDAAPPGVAVWCLLEEHANTLAIRAKTFGTEGDRLAVFELRPGLEDVRREITERHADVLVIDTLIEWAGALVTESSKAEQWRPIMAELRSVARDLNVAVIVLHHARKSDGVARDSSAITAAADVILEQKATHADGVQRITARGRWTVADFAVQLVDGKRYALAAGTVSGPPAQARGNRFKALDALPPEGLTFTAWERASGLTPSTFRRAAKALEASGDVQHVGELYKPRF